MARSKATPEPVSGSRKMTRQQVLELPPTCTIMEAAKAIGIGEQTMRDRLHAGKFPELVVLSLGRRNLIQTASLHAYLGLAPMARAS